MNYILHNQERFSYIEILQATFSLSGEDEALELAALCTENGTDRLLLQENNLDERFFDLKTGIAGAVLQKFSNYRIKFAAVVPADEIKGRFGEMAMEANKGKQFRFATSLSEASDWISGN